MLLDAGAFERLRGQRRRRAAQDERQAGADADAVQAAGEEVAARTEHHGTDVRHGLSTSGLAAHPSPTQLILRRAQAPGTAARAATLPASRPAGSSAVPSLPRRNSTSTARSLAASGTRQEPLDEMIDDLVDRVGAGRLRPSPSGRSRPDCRGISFVRSKASR